MALVLKDRVRETSISTGTGTINILGAVTGYQTFGSAIGSGNTCYYTIYNQGTNEWEVGLGTVGSGTLSRDTVLSSSNSGSLVSFTAGTKDVFVTYPAEKSVYEDASGNVSALGTITSGTWNATAITTAYGGTGLTSYTAGDIVYYSSGTALSKLGIGTNGYVLTSSGSAPQWVAASSIVGGAAGSNTQVQYNNSGALGASSSFTWDGTTLATPSASLSGNLNFTGTANRITGDFSNATLANRVAFQTSTTNGNTSVAFLTNGTGTFSQLALYNSNDPSNGTLFDALVNASEGRFRVLGVGTGSNLPMTFSVGGSERMRIDTSGNVGIGTSTPNSKLGLVTTAATAAWQVRVSNSGISNDSGIYADASNNMEFAARNGSGTLTLRLGSSGDSYINAGNVGIGTASPGSKLDVVGGSIGQYRSTGDNLGLSVLSGSTSFNSYVRMSNGTATVDYGQTNGAAFVNVNNSQPWYVNTGGTERLRINSSGEVLINTSSSLSTKLGIAGGALGTTSGDQVMLERTYTTTSNTSYIEISEIRTSAGSDWTTSGSRIQRKIDSTWHAYMQMGGTGLNEGIAFGTGGSTVSANSISERMRIDSTGSVSIGTTANWAKLGVNTGGQGNDGIMVGSSVTYYTAMRPNLAGGAYNPLVQAGDSAIIFSAGGVGTGNFVIAPWSSSSDGMRITTAGNVGIGVSNPTYKLQVAGTFTNTYTQIANGTATEYIGMSLTNAYTAGTGVSFLDSQGRNSVTDSHIYFFHYADYSSAISFATQPSGTNTDRRVERMRIDTNGNVAIGTTTTAATRFRVESIGGGSNQWCWFNTNTGGSTPNSGITTGISLGGNYSNGGAEGNIIYGNYLTFAEWDGTTYAERMRIDTNGNLLVGATSALVSNTHSFVNGGSSPITLRNSNSTAGRFWYTGPDSSANYLVYNNNSVGAFLVYGGTSWSSYSDERGKTAITPFENAVEKVSTLRAGTGRYLTDEESVSRSFLIAQDVQNVLPEAVTVQNDEIGTLALAYTDVIPLLVAAIQELKAELDVVKAELNTLKGN